MVKLFANSGDPDQMTHSVASDLGLHCLPITLLGVYRLQWVNPITLQPLYNTIVRFRAKFMFAKQLCCIKTKMYR